MDDSRCCNLQAPWRTRYLGQSDATSQQRRQGPLRPADGEGEGRKSEAARRGWFGNPLFRKTYANNIVAYAMVASASLQEGDGEEDERIKQGEESEKTDPDRGFCAKSWTAIINWIHLRGFYAKIWNAMINHDPVKGVLCKNLDHSGRLYVNIWIAITCHDPF